jgi:uncharacterized protein (DUF2345 family)
MGFFGGKPKMPDYTAIQQQAEERAKREREEAERKAFAEMQARMRVQQGRAATTLTDERTLLTGRSLLG